MARVKCRWELSEAISAARKTIKALDKYGKELEPRLPAGITEGLKVDLAMVSGAKVARPALVKTVKAKTGGERALAKDGADLLSRLRQAIKVCPGATAEILKAVGVGSQVNPGKTDSVAESLTAMLNAASAYVGVFRAAGILESDLAEARAILGGLLQADEAQHGAFDAKQDMTAQKDEAQLRIEQAVITVSAVGQTHFRKQPAKLAVFEKLAPKSPKKSGGNVTTGDQSTPKPPVTKA